MILRRIVIAVAAGSLFLTGGALDGTAASTNSPDFKQVFELLLTHLPGATAESLNDAAVAGLLAQLNGQAVLLGDQASPATNAAPLHAAILNQGTLCVIYLRVDRITDDLATRFSAAIQIASATNKPVGTILDLRFAQGDAYATVKAAAGSLIPAKTPLVVLVNHATRGAAEALAAELRASGAVIIGNPTAGQAMTGEEFPLANGQRLRVATTPIKLNGVDISPVQPDIAVNVSLADERAFLANPYQPADQGGSVSAEETNNFAELLDHTSEADLVRQKRKDGDGSQNPEPPAKTEVAPPVLRDPALARAVDLVAGLTALRAGRP